MASSEVDSIQVKTLRILNQAVFGVTFFEITNKLEAEGLTEEAIILEQLKSVQRHNATRAATALIRAFAFGGLVACPEVALATMILVGGKPSENPMVLVPVGIFSTIFTVAAAYTIDAVATGVAAVLARDDLEKQAEKILGHKLPSRVEEGQRAN